ncbi:hypothetical protein [Rhodococcus globerulus]|uniref:hypothetical protein n=1 Tax=Rhodococcus globerulus TaxID=33008 RepID=UPI000A5364EE|nr:hypothetical protein [Rhodococcus globerulus]
MPDAKAGEKVRWALATPAATPHPATVSVDVLARSTAMAPWHFDVSLASTPRGITSDTWTTYTRTPFDPALPARVTTITRAGNVSDRDIQSLRWVREIDPNPC